MKYATEESLTIDTTLRFALFGLECVFGVSFDGAECERVFRDSIEDQVSAKQYLLYQSKLLIVTGLVDDYEPEIVHLRIVSVSEVETLVKHVIENAITHSLRLNQSSEVS